MTLFESLTRQALRRPAPAGVAAAAAGDAGEMPAPAPQSAPASARKPRTRLGIALGGGAARGWAHIGVLHTLARHNLFPDVVAGTSIGAVVGGCDSAGKLPELETFARSLTKTRVVGLMDFHLGGAGLIAGGRLKRLLDRDLGQIRIEELSAKFVAIATEINSGHEIWLTHGPLVDAIRASYALPGVFNPVKLGGRWLMDGALVNPVPVTAARALGADVVICVNLNGDLSRRGTTIQSHSAEPDSHDILPLEEGEAGHEPRPTGWLGSQFHAVRDVARSWRGGPAQKAEHGPGLAAVMIDAFNITQDRISRSRLAGDPPDVMIAPKLGNIGLFEFHRAEEVIELGALATERAIDDIKAVMAADSELRR